MKGFIANYSLKKSTVYKICDWKGPSGELSWIPFFGRHRHRHQHWICLNFRNMRVILMPFTYQPYDPHFINYKMCCVSYFNFRCWIVYFNCFVPSRHVKTKKKNNGVTNRWMPTKHCWVYSKFTKLNYIRENVTANAFVRPYL